MSSRRGGADDERLQRCIDDYVPTALTDASADCINRLIRPPGSTRWPPILADAEYVTLQAARGGGRLAYVVDAGRFIGIDRSTGEATRVYTVITDSGGNLVTAHPGLPAGG